MTTYLVTATWGAGETEPTMVASEINRNGGVERTYPVQAINLYGARTIRAFLPESAGSATLLAFKESTSDQGAYVWAENDAAEIIDIDLATSLGHAVPVPYDIMGSLYVRPYFTDGTYTLVAPGAVSVTFLVKT